MARKGCPDLDPMWPGSDGKPRGPALCVLYPRCTCGDSDRRQAAKSDAAKDRDDARSWRNAIEGAKEPGDPVLRAIAELLSCTYLDAVPTPADDDMRRELAVAARVANDELRIKAGVASSLYSEKRDAAKWRKVEPLIDRLCGAVGAAHLVSRAESERRITEIASAILAAAKEPS